MLATQRGGGCEWIGFRPPLRGVGSQTHSSRGAGSICFFVGGAARFSCPRRRRHLPPGEYLGAPRKNFAPRETPVERISPLLERLCPRTIFPGKGGLFFRGRLRAPFSTAWSLSQWGESPFSFWDRKVHPVFEELLPKVVSHSYRDNGQS